MYEMHAHLGQDGALLNLLAGVTQRARHGQRQRGARRAGAKIEAGEIAGPHVVRSGFIEGKSPFSANNGIVVDSEEKAARRCSLVRRARALADQGLQQHEPRVGARRWWRRHIAWACASPGMCRLSRPPIR